MVQIHFKLTKIQKNLTKDFPKLYCILRKDTEMLTVVLHLDFH